MSGERHLTGAARLAGVMGHPVAHSLSPRLHGHWLGRYGIDGAYLPLAVRSGDLERALRALPALGFAGCNLTIPHKEQALRLVDEADAAAGRIGAVNTVVVGEGGRLLGGNSDGFGFLESLRQGAPAGFRAEAAPAVVLGAGGAARAIVAALLDAGAAEIRVVNRTLERAQELASTFGPRIRPLGWRAIDAALDGAGLLVNGTSLGMAHQPPLGVALDALPPATVVADIVYVPLETPLLAAARARGNPVVDGLGMLLHQARPGFRAWFGVDPEVDEELRRVVLAGLSRP